MRFSLAKSPTGFLLQSPVFVVVEAKKNDIEEGLGQCVANGCACRFSISKKKRTALCLRLCKGHWQFVKLEKDTLRIEKTRYYIKELEKILWVFYCKNQKLTKELGKRRND